MAKKVAAVKTVYMISDGETGCKTCDGTGIFGTVNAVGINRCLDCNRDGSKANVWLVYMGEMSEGRFALKELEKKLAGKYTPCYIEQIEDREHPRDWFKEAVA